MSGLIKLLLMVLMLVGAWLLINSSGTTFLIGFLLCLLAVVGWIVLARRQNSLPLQQDERAAWELTRAKGKRLYVLRSIMYGFVLGLIFPLYQLIHSRSTGEPLTANSGFLLFFIILFIGGSYLAAVKTWSLNEERFKEKR